ncbi:hypothetical protein Ciccas_004841 [Cichlidogyrus casuarinus]|uniref:Uncharacterized protein n=1 Tax=Cichlidogyrus casuarinus TaxID=1844966 RepID=A0ABD2QAD6_9PLAT
MDSKVSASRMMNLLYEVDERLAAQINGYRQWMQLPGAMFKDSVKSSQEESPPGIKFRNRSQLQKPQESTTKREVVSTDASEENLKLNAFYLHWAFDNTLIFKNFRTSFDATLLAILPSADVPEQNQLRQ